MLVGPTDDSRRAMTRDTLLQWVKDHQSAQPSFQAGDTLTFDDLEETPPVSAAWLL